MAEPPLLMVLGNVLPKWACHLRSYDSQSTESTFDVPSSHQNHMILFCYNELDNLDYLEDW